MSTSRVKQARLKELLEYNPLTGQFTWEVTRNWKAQKGSVAGRTHHEGYIRIKVDNIDHAAHRLAWIYMKGDENQPYQIDHKDMNKANNKWDNLRGASNGENQRNTKLRKDNKSGIKGVYWHKITRKWAARIQVDNKDIHLGVFSDIGCAKKAVQKARLKLHKEFANHGDTNE